MKAQAALIGFFSALVIFTIPVPVRAISEPYPPPMPPQILAALPLERVAALAEAVAGTGEILVKRSYTRPFNHTRFEFQAINYNEMMTIVAEQLHRQARLAPPGDRQITAAMYQILREKYLLAQPYFELLQGTPAVREALARMNGAMAELARLFGEDLAAMAPAGGVVTLVAGRVAVLAGRLDARAAAEAAARRVAPADLAPFARITAAARRFSEHAAAVHGDPTTLAADYGELIAALLAARPVLAGFTMNLQGDYGELWHLAQNINFAGPQAAVGGAVPYGYHFWQD